MSNFKDCFGDLPAETQESLKRTLTAMTNVINAELKDHPVQIGWTGYYDVIQLKKPEPELPFKFVREVFQ